MFKIEFRTGNAAFEDNAGLEVARILRELSDKAEHGELEGLIRDVNGNTIGKWGLE